jgi:hypothetical protein
VQWTWHWLGFTGLLFVLMIHNMMQHSGVG